MILYISPAIVLYTQVFLQPIAQAVVLLLHFSAENHYSLQSLWCFNSWIAYRASNLGSLLYKTLETFSIIRSLNNTSYTFYVCWTVHLGMICREKNQLDATRWFIELINPLEQHPSTRTHSLQPHPRPTTSHKQSVSCHIL